MSDEDEAGRWREMVRLDMDRASLTVTELLRLLKVDYDSSRRWLGAGSRLPDLAEAEAIHEIVGSDDQARTAYLRASGQASDFSAEQLAMMGNWTQVTPGGPVAWDDRLWTHKAGPTREQITLDGLGKHGRIWGSAERTEGDAMKWRLEGTLDTDGGFTLAFNFHESAMGRGEPSRRSRGFIYLCRPTDNRHLLEGLYVTQRSAVLQDGPAPDTGLRPKLMSGYRSIHVVPRPITWVKETRGEGLTD